MSRGIDTALAAVVAAPHVDGFVLIDAHFDSGSVYISGSGFDVAYGGNTYQTLYGLMSLDAIEETDQIVRGISIELSGVPQDVLAVALAEPVQGRPINIRSAFVVDGQVQVDPNVWTGLMDTMSIQDGEQPRVRLTAEHRLVTWDRPRLVRFSDQDQQARFPGDKFFEYAAKLAEQPIAWPNKEYFKR